jgi:hypothetical protein
LPPTYLANLPTQTKYFSRSFPRQPHCQLSSSSATCLRSSPPGSDLELATSRSVCRTSPISAAPARGALASMYRGNTQHVAGRRSSSSPQQPTPRLQQLLTPRPVADSSWLSQRASGGGGGGYPGRIGARAIPAVRPGLRRAVVFEPSPPPVQRGRQSLALHATTDRPDSIVELVSSLQQAVNCTMGSSSSKNLRSARSSATAATVNSGGSSALDGEQSTSPVNQRTAKNKKTSRVPNLRLTSSGHLLYSISISDDRMIGQILTPELPEGKAQ